MSGEASGRTLTIGTRGSALALRQTDQTRDRIARLNPGLAVEVQVITTAGDRLQEWPPPSLAPAQGGGKGIFVKEIEQALLERRVDAAVHSMKDLPTSVPPGLRVAAIPGRVDPRDVLATDRGHSFESLPAGARVGTGSPRRVSQLRRSRPDLNYVPIRGNVDTRLRKMREGDVDAVVLAAAGLTRLGLLESRFSFLPVEICLPAVGQGALAIETRDEEGWVQSAVGPLHDPGTAACVAAERAFLAGLGGGCQVPIAGFATLEDGRLLMIGVVCDLEGERLVRVESSGTVGDAVAIGSDAARQALDRGASEILGPLEGRPDA